MNAIFKYLGCAVMAAVLYGCTPRVPETYTDNRELPDIYPDYTEVTIPSNIAPLHFIVDEEADAYITRISYNGKKWVTDKREVTPGISLWRDMLEATQGKTIGIEGVSEWKERNLKRDLR